MNEQKWGLNQLPLMRQANAYRLELRVYGLECVYLTYANDIALIGSTVETDQETASICLQKRQKSIQPADFELMFVILKYELATVGIKSWLV